MEKSKPLAAKVSIEINEDHFSIDSLSNYEQNTRRASKQQNETKRDFSPSSMTFDKVLEKRTTSRDVACQNCGFGPNDSVNLTDKGNRIEEEISPKRSTVEQIEPIRSPRRVAKKKDGEEEFFNMTYLSNLLPHPKC